MKIIKHIFIIYFLLSGIAFSYSQGYLYHQFEGAVGHGFVAPHRKDLNYLIKERIMMGEITYSHKTDGGELWHHTWRFPEVGVGYVMTELSNFGVFGHAHSFFGFYGVPVFENERLLFKYRFGMGVAYLSEKFDYRINYNNIAIGTNINAHIHFSVSANIKLWETPLYFIAGANFNHFSNAAFKKPNMGLNLITLNSGFKYMFSDYDYVLPKRLFPYKSMEYYFTMYYGTGSRQNTTYENKNYVVQSIVADFTLRINNKRAFGIGTNIIFDPSLKTQIRDFDRSDYKGAQDLFRLGFHLVQDVFFTDDIVCIIQLGTYAYNKFNDKDKKFMIYNRLGIRYIFNEYFVANFMIRSHTSVADFAELGVGYRIKI